MFSRHPMTHVQSAHCATLVPDGANLFGSSGAAGTNRSRLELPQMAKRYGHKPFVEQIF